MIKVALTISSKYVLALAIVMIFMMQSLGFFDWSLLTRLENDAYTTRLKLTMPNTQDDRVVIIDIDEKSLTEEGRWPWRRDRMAILVNQLFDHYHISTLGFDVVFAEPDTTGSALLSALPESIPEATRQLLENKLDHDSAFTQALKGRNIVLGYYFKETTDKQPSSGQLPKPTFPDFAFDQPLPVRDATGYGANLASFQKAAKNAGHFNPKVDDDGMVRRVALLMRYEKNYYAALSLAMVKAYLKQGIDPVFAQGWGVDNDYVGLEKLIIDNKIIPVDHQVQVLIPYRGKAESYRYISASDVIHQRIDTQALANKIVLMGTTAPGLLDLRSTPVSPVYPGVEIHANLISGMLDGVIKERPAWASGAEMVTIILISLFMMFLLPNTALWATLMTLALVSALTAFNLWLWLDKNLVLAIAQPLMLVIALYIFYMVYGFFIESRNKLLLSRRFGQYVPPELVDEMASNPESYSLESESKPLSVLFTDVRGFTSISEGLSATELAELMNAYLTPMTRVIHQHRGTIDKYMGDAIMAFWGAPIHNEHHAKYALDCALNMLITLKAINADFAQRGWPEIKIGVGINSGIMTVGNMGSEFRMAYTVMGDEVNLGSRLEGITKEYGVALIVSESTKNSVPEYTYRELDRVRVKGKELPITIYEPIAKSEQLTEKQQQTLQIYQQALEAYRLQQWDIAEEKFCALKNSDPLLKVYGLYCERIAHFKTDPPPKNWDGVFTFTTK
jgi:adenylate cyclase